MSEKCHEQTSKHSSDHQNKIAGGGSQFKANDGQIRQSSKSSLRGHVFADALAVEGVALLYST
jgi:hypothetical protein